MTYATRTLKKEPINPELIYEQSTPDAGSVNGLARRGPQSVGLQPSGPVIRSKNVGQPRISPRHPSRLTLPLSLLPGLPQGPIPRTVGACGCGSTDLDLITHYVAQRRQSCRERMVASDLRKIRAALQLVCPTSEWSWLLSIAKRIEAQASPKSERHHLVTSDRLYALGIELMDRAIAGSIALGKPTEAQALQYRGHSRGPSLRTCSTDTNRRTASATPTHSIFLRCSNVTASTRPRLDAESVTLKS